MSAENTITKDNLDFYLRELAKTFAGWIHSWSITGDHSPG